MTRNRIMIAAILIIAGAAALFVLLPKESGIEYSPKNKNNSSGPIVIKAIDTVSDSQGTYTIEPQVAGKLQIVENYIIFWPKESMGFADDKRYTATFNNYKTARGENINIPVISFSVDKNTSYSALQREVMSRFGRFEAETNPFLSKLPHTEAYRYRISYIINDIPENEGKDIEEIIGNEENWREKKQNYTVIIETLVIQGRGDSQTTYVEEIRKARAEAIKWINEQGVDPNKDILYQFVPDDKALNNPSRDNVDIPLD